MGDRTRDDWVGRNRHLLRHRGVAFGAPGIAWCDDAIDSLRCDQHYVNFSDNGAVTPVRACHETGHAVGLLHGSDATPAVDDLTPELFCMQAPTAAIASNTGLGAHNTAHVNVVY